MSFIVHNGILREEDDLIFSSKNRSFRYGDGFFESIKIVNNQVPFWKYHYERLSESAKALKLIIPVGLNAAKFLKWMELLMEKNAVKSGGRARITIYREAAGMYAPEQNAAGFILEVYPSLNNFFEWNNKPYIVDFYEEHLKSLDSLSNIKSNNALLYVLASVFMQEKKLDESILLNSNHRICEGSSSNVFIFKNDELLTPPLNEGCLNGVMRRVTTTLAAENNYLFGEVPLSKEEFLAADEIFLTSGTRGIISVGGVGKKRYFNTQTKKLFTLLNEKVKQLTH